MNEIIKVISRTIGIALRKKLIIILSLSFTMNSCSTSKLKMIEKNRSKNIEKITEQLFNKHNNAFYHEVSYYSSYIVWYYEGDTIIYRAYDGRKINKCGFIVPQCKNYENDIKFPDFVKCLTLDGECIGYKIYQKNQIVEENYPTDVICLFKQDTLSQNCFLLDVKAVLRANNVVVDDYIYYVPTKKQPKQGQKNKGI